MVEYVTDHPEATCTACSQVLTQPLELACSHHICCQCLCNRLQQSGQLHCPSCHQELPLVPESVRKPPPLLLSFLGGLEVRCATCERTVMVKHLDIHFKSGCTRHVNVNIDDILVQPLSTPTTHKEKQLASSVVRRMLNEEKSCSIKIPTGGRVGNFNFLIPTFNRKCSYLI